VRNGNIALGLGVLAIALLAASGKLKQLWDAIMSAGTQGPGASGTSGSGTSGGMQSVGTAAINTGTAFLPPDTGPASDPSAAGSWASIPGVTSGQQAGAAAILAAITGKQGASNTTIVAGANPALDDVFAKWPAGRQTEWNAFLTCYASTGSVDVCARRGLVLSTEGRG
jgi:hypothetical protein